MQKIRDILASISSSSDPDLTLRDHACSGLAPDYMRDLVRRGHTVYQGKVRDVVTVGNEIHLAHSDRLTAFDRSVSLVPYRGVILTAISKYWFEASRHLMPNHFIEQSHERVIRARRSTPFKVEMVVRGYLAGSMMRTYLAGELSFCGHRLPSGLQAFGKLPEPIITPTTKAPAYHHDENSNPAELIADGVCTDKEWEEMATMALTLFKFGAERYHSIGWMLVDTKYEFGRSEDGKIILIDEAHTPDSSRLWVASTYEARRRAGELPEMFDKEIVRRYLLDQGFSGEGPVPTIPAELILRLAAAYLTVAESLTGQPLMTEGPIRELRLNL